MHHAVRRVISIRAVELHVMIHVTQKMFAIVEIIICEKTMMRQWPIRN